MATINLDPRYWRSYFDWPREIYLGHDEMANIHRFLKIKDGVMYEVYLYQRHLRPIKVLASRVSKKSLLYKNHSDFVYFYNLFNDRF